MIIKESKDKSKFVSYGGGVKYYNRDKPELSDFFQKIDKPIAVIAPGKDVLREVSLLPDDCLYFAVNYHFLRSYLFNFTYLGFLDDPGRGVNSSIKKTLYGEFDGVVFSNKMEWTDINIVKEEPLIVGDSGIFALWIALYLTSEKVYACGFDCRQSGYHRKSRAFKHSEPVVEPKYGRWNMLMKSAHNPQRLQIFNDDIYNFLVRRYWKFDE